MVDTSMFRPPDYLPPRTTLVPRSKLPPNAKVVNFGHHHRSSIANVDGASSVQEGSDDVNELVEVYIDSLMADTNNTTTSERDNDLHKRPLGGNLSSKLVEYTRGTMGVRRPFRPGGMDDDDNETDNAENVENNDAADECCSNPFLSEEATRNARRALTIGSKRAYEEGILIMAPPGVSFTEGLRCEDVFIDGDQLVRKEAPTTDRLAANDDAMTTNETATTATQRQSGNAFTAPAASKTWDRSYFDDDSLFGDSTSRSDSDDDDGSDDDDQEDVEKRNEGNELQKNLRTEGKAKATIHIPLADMPQDPVDEVDALLFELLSLDQPARAFAKSSLTSVISVHPPVSSIGTAVASKDNAKTRKSWAITDYIPIASNSDFHALLPNPALTFPFELDDFQKQALLRLERSECVFLAAHTSAGKTVCAEYAIALAMKHCTRAIYTSPIKALSNQKYRDFRNKFGEDVGLITGDMQIGADGSCLIMTTEILRSMLYRGADLIRDIEWVIFDEVHYINDSERGVVWEEVIIMLPDYVNLIFLSATTPNTIEFSEWIGRTKRKPVHVITTNYRPVPLSHHLWAGNKLHNVMEGRQGFNPKGYADATKALLPASARLAAEKKGEKAGKAADGKKPAVVPSRPTTGSKMSSWQQQGGKQEWISLARFLEKEEMMPTVTFSFSKKKCEEIAEMLRSLDLNTAAERNLVSSFTIQTVARLSPNDQCLPQVIKTVEMVKRGIGVHHGGLLPILKEMVEILFSRGLVKILFATETFAMGVNMPARSVVFNSIRKHDGVQFRELQPGEYTQMAGRAGRRGLDKVGTVILCAFGDTPPPQQLLKNMLTGSSTKLQSQFRLTYTMILNLLRVEDMSVEGMIKRSFSEFATQRALTTNEYPKLLARGTKTLLKLDEEFKQNEDSRIGCEDVEEYFHACRNVLSSTKKLLTYVLGSGGTGGGALVAGRIILVTAARKQRYVCTPALVLKPPEVTSSNANCNDDLSCVCMVLLPQSFTRSSVTTDQNELKIGSMNYVGEAKCRFFTIQKIRVDEIFLISSVKYKIDATVFYREDATKTSARELPAAFANPFANAKSMKARDDGDNPFAGMKARGKKGENATQNRGSGLSQESQLVDDAISYLLDAEKTENNSGLSMLDLKDCAKNMHQGNSAIEFGSACSRLEGEVACARQFQSHYHPSIESHYVIVERKETLRSRVKILRHLLSNESLQLFPDFEMRKAMLQSLGYVDENDTVCLKGRVACEVNTCEGLIVTEMVFGGMLNELEPPEIVAALSALLFQEKADDDIGSDLPERLISSCERMKGIAIDLGQRQKDFGLPVDPLEYCASSLKFGLIHVVYEWACGVPFSSICELTDVQEGSIVRCITRLDELCREVRNCARVVGNPTLYRKMEAASEAIKRDIVFASSLYVT
jgi:antiviral helicase SKI2